MFKKNIDSLQKINPSLAEKLLSVNLEFAQEKISVHQAESSDLIIAHQNNILDDLKSPITSAREVWDSLIKAPLAKNDVVIVYGLGLGYLFKRSFVSSPSRIVVFEPLLEVLRFVLEYVDFSEQFDSGRVNIFSAKNEVKSYIDSKYLLGDKVEIIYNPSYAKLFGEELIAFSKEIYESCTLKSADVNTIRLHSKHWAKNIVENSKLLDSLIPLSSLSNCFEGKTALIVAAGPSLKKNIELIKENRDKFVIFSVNKIVEYLIKNGVIPDFLVAADAMGLYLTMPKLEQYAEKINVIATIKTDSSIFKQNFASKTIYFLENDSFSQKLQAKFPEEIKLFDTGGTAVSQCYFSALEMGFDKIIFAGLDLALKDEEAYAGEGGNMTRNESNIFFEFELNEIDPKTGKPKMLRIKKGLKQIKSFDGSDIWTRDDYYVFIRQLSEIFSSNSRAKLYNITDFGAKIEGMQYVPFEKVLEKLNLQENNVLNVLSSKKEENSQLMKLIYEYSRSFLEEEKNIFEKMEKLINGWKNSYENKLTKLFSMKRFDITVMKSCQQSALSIVNLVLKSELLSSAFQVELLDFANLNKQDVLVKVDDYEKSFRQILNMFNKVLQQLDILK